MMLLNAIIGLAVLGAGLSATISSKEASKKVGAEKHFLSDYVTAGIDCLSDNHFASCCVTFDSKHPFFSSYEV